MSTFWTDQAMIGTLLGNYGNNGDGKYYDNTGWYGGVNYDFLKDFHSTPEAYIGSGNVLATSAVSSMHGLYFGGASSFSDLFWSPDNGMATKIAITTNLQGFTSVDGSNRLFCPNNGNGKNYLLLIQYSQSTYYVGTKNLGGNGYVGEFANIDFTTLPYDCNIQSMINVNAPNRQTFTSLTGRTTATKPQNITYNYSLNFTFSYDAGLLGRLKNIFLNCALNGSPLFYLPAQSALSGSTETNVTYGNRPLYWIMPSQIPQIQQMQSNIFTFTIDGVDAL